MNAIRQLTREQRRDVTLISKDVKVTRYKARKPVLKPIPDSETSFGNVTDINKKHDLKFNVFIGSKRVCQGKCPLNKKGSPHPKGGGGGKGNIVKTVDSAKI